MPPWRPARRRSWRVARSSAKTLGPGDADGGEAGRRARAGAARRPARAGRGGGRRRAELGTVVATPHRRTRREAGPVCGTQPAGPGLVAHAGHQAGPLEQAHGPGLVGVDHHGVLGLPSDDEGDHAVVAHVGVAVGALGTVDGQCAPRPSSARSGRRHVGNETTTPGRSPPTAVRTGVARRVGAGGSRCCLLGRWSGRCLCSASCTTGVTPGPDGRPRPPPASRPDPDPVDTPGGTGPAPPQGGNGPAPRTSNRTGTGGRRGRTGGRPRQRPSVDGARAHMSRQR